MESTKSFRDLKVWQEAHQFVLQVYVCTKHFPKEELFGLTSQLRRAAISIAANIAEGYPKRSKNDKLRFLNISQGSLEECRYYIILSHDLQYVDVKEQKLLSDLLDSASRLLNSYYNVIDKSR